jgi:Sensors of blue-light using FAD
MTYQIIYSSESATPMQMEDLDEILEDARSSNASQGITGALVYVEGVFLQILEGERDVVEALMGKIARDVRHETVTVLREAEVPAAVFKDWKMAYVSATAEQVAKWAGLSGTADIPEILTDLRQDPHRATQVAQSILSLLAPENAAPRKPD